MKEADSAGRELRVLMNKSNVLVSVRANRTVSCDFFTTWFDQLMFSLFLRQSVNQVAATGQQNLKLTRAVCASVWGRCNLYLLASPPCQRCTASASKASWLGRQPRGSILSRRQGCEGIRRRGCWTLHQPPPLQPPPRHPHKCEKTHCVSSAVSLPGMGRSRVQRSGGW